MTGHRNTLLLTVLAATLLAWGPAEARRFTEHAESTFERTIDLGDRRHLVVDNLFGEIRISGTGGNSIRLVAVERIAARGPDELEQAKREVRLAVHERGSAIVICADGPFRDPSDCTEWRKGHRSRYEVRYDLELEVPHEIELDVKTIEGEIHVAGIYGDFDVRGVNGGVEMVDVAGSGSAATVNGAVRVSFAENPRDGADFKTINGEIDVQFQPNLSADLSFQTMNGQVRTDFDYQLLPPRPVEVRSKGGSTTYRLDKTSQVRVAAGGPELRFENINGDILIRRDE